MNGPDRAGDDVRGLEALESVTKVICWILKMSIPIQFIYFMRQDGLLKNPNIAYLAKKRFCDTLHVLFEVSNDKDVHISTQKNSETVS